MLSYHRSHFGLNSHDGPRSNALYQRNMSQFISRNTACNGCRFKALIVCLLSWPSLIASHSGRTHTDGFVEVAVTTLPLTRSMPSRSHTLIVNEPGVRLPAKRANAEPRPTTVDGQGVRATSKGEKAPDDASQSGKSLGGVHWTDSAMPIGRERRQCKR